MLFWHCGVRNKPTVCNCSLSQKLLSLSLLSVNSQKVVFHLFTDLTLPDNVSVYFLFFNFKFKRLFFYLKKTIFYPWNFCFLKQMDLKFWKNFQTFGLSHFYLLVYFFKKIKIFPNIFFAGNFSTNSLFSNKLKRNMSSQSSIFRVWII